MLVVAVAVIAVDQLSKAIATRELAPGEVAMLPLGFELSEATNSGLAFGLFAGGDAPLVALTAIVLAGLLVWFARRADEPRAWLAFGLVAGGVTANLIDRVRLDHVVDFIDPPTEAWTQFNLADLAISCGTLALVLTALFGRPRGPA